ncbi:DUF4331 family protein [Sphingobacterium rhinopitheci]|uniref:DUF4331 family protein n=1 Tax=Sphingobacterium rhinopitheci TaxID=2781960 RepID=UPI001F51E7E6|nr:DUF4331 family protein [Sphingobacterium rhinopitheci]MCI0922707.1 DUF4331 family protein [Sphingobacterium rhinopitheci]
MKSTILGFLMVLTTIFGAWAGHHMESDLAKKYPQLDLTDIFVFKSPTPGKTVFIMGFNPKSMKDSLNNYADNGIYRFCIGADADFFSGISPTFTFKNNKIQFYLANQAEPPIGSTGTLIGEGPINRQLQFSNGVNIFTGTVLDLFQGNSTGIRAFREMAAAGKFDLSAFDIGEKGNIFAKLSSTVIVLEVPNELLPKEMWYYATTAVEVEPDHWHRVNRIAHVLFPHLYLLDKDLTIKYLESNHEVDPKVKQGIYNNVLNYIKLAGYKSNPEEYATVLLNRVYPDVMTYTIGTDAEYTISKINGRPLQADAMDVALALLVGSDSPIDDKVSISLERFQDVFPFVVPIDNDYIDAADKIVKVEVISDTAKATTDDHKEETSNTIWYILGAAVFLFIIILVSKKKR